MKTYLIIILIILTSTHNFPQTGDTIWTKLPPLDNSGKPIFDVHFIDENRGYVTGGTFGSLKGSHRIGITTDGGYSWDTTRILTSGWGRCIEFLNENVGFAGSSNIFRTIDAGQNWEKVFMPLGVSIRSIEFTDKKNGWAAGVAPPRIFKTNDAGLTWVEKFPGDTLNQGFFMSVIDSCTVYIASRESLHFSNNDGDSWNLISIPASFNIGRIAEIKFITKNYGMLFYENCGVW